MGIGGFGLMGRTGVGLILVFCGVRAVLWLRLPEFPEERV